MAEFQTKPVHGIVYQKDLGPNTLEIARRIDRFNPDQSWSPVFEK
jgi:DUF2950 family protein